MALPPRDAIAPGDDSPASDVFRALDILAADCPALGVAVSGGSDSTALLLLTADWARARGVRLHAATVDHGLRPEAAAEARDVASLCARLGVAHDTLTWRPPHGTRIAQADARGARHRLLAHWARANALPAIAIGHTRDDRIETFLIRARAGSGWWGLAGPAPRSASPDPEAGDLMLLRPLLGVLREALRDTLRQRGEGWADDPSNTALRFERVRMRALAGRLDGDVQAKVIACMDRLAALRAATQAGARAHLARAETGGGLRLPGVSNLAPEVRLRLVEALVIALGQRPLPPRTDRLARLADALAGQDFPSLTLGGVWFTRLEDQVLVRPAPARRASASPPAFSGEAGLIRVRALLVDPRLEALADKV